MKEKIIENSIVLFDSKGFSETSIQEIVDSIGVTKGTFYYYFNSKEELLMDIHLRYISNIVELQRRIMENEKTDCKTKLYEIILMLIHGIEKNGLSARVFFREIRHLNEENLAKVSKERDTFGEELQKLVELGIANGEFREELRKEIKIIVFAILGVTNWSYNWFDPNGRLSADELSQIYYNILLKGIER